MRRAAELRATAALLAGLFAGPADAVDPPPDAVLAELPFLDDGDSGHIVVDLAPPGVEPRPFLVHTGFSYSYATPSTARQLSLSVRSHKRDPYRRETLLGREVLIQVDASSSDTPYEGEWDHVVLGGQFLAEYVVELDFQQRRMRLLDPERYAVADRPQGPDESVLPMKLRGQVPSVPVLLEGRPVQARVSTGTRPPLLIDRRPKEPPGPSGAPVRGFETGDPRQPEIFELHRIEALTLGAETFRDLPAEVLANGEARTGAPVEAALGYELLRHFLVRIDYPRGRLWLQRRRGVAPSFYGREYESFDDLLGPRR